MRLTVILCLLALTGCLKAQITYQSFGPNLIVGRDYLPSDTVFDDLCVRYLEGVLPGVPGGTFQTVTIRSWYGRCAVVARPQGSRAALLEIGDTIGPNSRWLPQSTDFYGHVITYHDVTMSPDPAFYCKYVGFRQHVNGDTLYGWLSVEKDTVGGAKLRLKGYAIGQIPGQPVVVDENCLVSVDGPDLPTALQLGPNPARDHLLLRLQGMEGDCIATIHDTRGVMVRSFSMRGGQTADLMVGDLSRGLYHLQVSNEDAKLAAKVVLE